MIVGTANAMRGAISSLESTSTNLPKSWGAVDWTRFGPTLHATVRAVLPVLVAQAEAMDGAERRIAALEEAMAEKDRVIAGLARGAQ